MTERLRNGTKEIIEYIRPRLGLSFMCEGDTCKSPAWRAIKRLMKLHGLDAIIIFLPSGRPQMSEADFDSWLEKYRRRRVSRSLGTSRMI